MARNLQRKDSIQIANPLLQALSVEDQLARHEEIAGILVGLHEDKAVALLFDALLKSVNNESRTRVIEELARIGSTKAIELLGSIMSDDFDPEVQRHALEALRRIGTEAAIDRLLSVLRGDDEVLRWEAARALGDFSSDKVVDALIEFTKSPFLRIDPAILSLANIGSDRATDQLVSIMRDVYRNDVNSYYATEALVRLGTSKAIDGLLQAWNDDESIHRMRLYGILSQSKPQHLITPLRQRLQDKNLSSLDRRASAEMLGIIGRESDISFLKSIWTDWSEDSDRDVGWVALRAAEQIALSELEKRAERERSLEEMRALIAHGFRHALTPLNAYVKMFESALAEPNIDKKKLLSLTTRIRKQTDAAFDLVNQYLHYSRPLAPEFKEVDVAGLIKDILKEFKTQLENRRILLKTKFIGNVNIEVEQHALVEVLRNIIMNSIQAMEKGGALSISVESDEDILKVAVRDTGIGIKPEYLPHMFDFGFTTKTRPAGSGFGLALSKRLVEAHNGSLTIANNASEKGAIVVITLPRKQREIGNGRQRHTSANHRRR